MAEPGDTVWAVIQSINYEGDVLIRVCSSKEKAEERREEERGHGISDFFVVECVLDKDLEL